MFLSGFNHEILMIIMNMIKRDQQMDSNDDNNLS